MLSCCQSVDGGVVIVVVIVVTSYPCKVSSTTTISQIKTTHIYTSPYYHHFYYQYYNMIFQLHINIWLISALKISFQAISKNNERRSSNVNLTGVVAA